MGIKISLYVLDFYQKWISPLKGPTCRFIPSCSAYTVEAIKYYGFLFGWYLGIKRIFKCHPWHSGGYDPVPEIPEKKWKRGA